jgi:transmembrane sensor
MNHSTATAAELATDHDFIQWVKFPTDERTAYWKRFSDERPEHAVAMAEARRLVLLLSQEQAGDEPCDKEAQQVWEQLQHSLRQGSGDEGEGGRVVSLWGMGRSAWWAVAAAVTVVLASVAVLLYRQQPMSVTYATNYGETRTIQLSDNSVVVLNANSSITIPDKWKENQPRTVQLSGEAFFSVRQEENKRQFVVKTSKGTEVQVLGTEFNVYDRGTEDRVVLASGQVRLQRVLQGKVQQMDMQPGDMVTVSPESGLSRRRVDPSLYTAWQQNKLYFDNYTLQQVAELLHDQYGYTVSFADKTIAEQRITAFLEVLRPEDITGTLAETFNLQITQNEKTIFISSL